MIRRHLLRAFLRLIRETRARGSAVLVVAALLVTGVSLWAFRREAELVHEQVSWHESLYYTLGLFALQGNRFGYPHTWLLRTLCFLAPLISASALLGAFARLVEESGSLVLRRFRGHTVIGGLGHLGAAIADAEEQQLNPYLVIERDGSSPQAVNVRASGNGAVLVGDMTSAEVLRRARCHLARQIFLTSPSDIANLDAAFQVRRLTTQRHIASPPTIFAHVFDGGLAESLEDELRAHRADQAIIVPFNSYRFAAKALIALLLRERLLHAVQAGSDHALVRTDWNAEGETLNEAAPEEVESALEEDRRRLMLAFRLSAIDERPSAQRLAVVGLGRFGRSVLGELLSGSTPRDARYLVVERSEEHFLRSVAGLPPEDRARIDFHCGDATQPDAAARIREFGPSAALVCTDNDLGNLRLALDLNRRGIRTIARMFDLEASSELARGFEERGVMTVGLARLFRAAIPVLTHERRLLASIDLDIRPTPRVDHLFFLARLTVAERRRLGRMCVGLGELPCDAGCAAPREDLGLVWYQAVPGIDPYYTPAPSPVDQP